MHMTMHWKKLCVYIPTSIALELFEHECLFSDYISTQTAEGRDKRNNHPVFLSCRQFTFSFYQPNLTTERNKFPLDSTKLACVYGYVTRCLKCLKDALGTAGFHLEYQECLIALASPLSHTVTPSRVPTV